MRHGFISVHRLLSSVNNRGDLHHIEFRVWPAKLTLCSIALVRLDTSTVGQKIDWTRKNTLVCVEADEVVSPQQWMSVVVFGRYEELPNTPEYQPQRAVAHNVLQEQGVVGARLRENDPARHRAPVGAGL